MRRDRRLAAPHGLASLLWLAAALGPGAGAARAQAGDRAPSALVRASTARDAARGAARFDPIFRKYSKRYFGIAFDWRRFKAQAMAESNLDTAAVSWVGARGLMQLMPSTFAAIRSARPEYRNIDDPEWNVAAGIAHDRGMWKLWPPELPDSERVRFMFGAYNAGEGPITRANATAAARKLAPNTWSSIEAVAPSVPRWRYRETLGYVRRITSNYDRLKNP
ncbi:MAG: transglycosylase SLT domain-containing protein [Gemmatimonadota bacterium]|nr:transglycosylase SLT domain-containing protein [Gemmatimonadota bacterium]